MRPKPAGAEPAQFGVSTGHAWRGLGVSLLGAAVLHAALAAAVAGHADGLRDPQARTPMAASMQVRTVAAEPIATQQPVPVTASPDELQSPAAGASMSSGAHPAPGQRYFDTSEVDTSAMPLPEWQVDVPTLMALGVRSVSVDVLISEAGVTQQCAVTRIEPQQPPALQLAVASRLCETVLRPAQRHGVAVASVRHIELVLAAD